MNKYLALTFLLTTTLLGGELSTKPNIILILSDDQGYGDIERHGHPFLKTPNMNRLHDESVRMTDFSVSPTCAPTRAALMTGMQEFNSGVTHTVNDRRKLNKNVFTLPHLLKDAGYSTGMFGKWHLGHSDGYRPDQRGFDESLTVPADNQRSHYDPELLRNGKPVKSKGYRTDIFFDAAMEWMGQQGEAPFFCYIPTYNAHSPLIVPEQYTDPYKELAEAKTAKFFGMIANLDENIGRLLEFLETSEQSENTLIIFINDNGGTFGVDTYNAGMRGCKGTIWRGGIRAFCFWHWPGKWNPRDEQVLSGHVDVLPTLLEIAGGELTLETSYHIEGISLAKRLKTPNSPWPDRMLYQHVSRWHDGMADQHQHVNASVRWRKWHLMNLGIVEGCMTGECRIYRKVQNGEPLLYTKKPGEHYKLSVSKNWELYHLGDDPGEEMNLAEENPEIVEKMARSYDHWWEKVRPWMINEIH